MIDQESISHFNFPTRIHFGPGSRRLLAKSLQQGKLHRGLVVTDPGVAQLPFVSELQRNLLQSGIHTEIFAGISSNPVKSQVALGVTAFKEAHAEVILAIGGGAALDVAKAIALMVYHPGDLFDYEDGKPNASPIDQLIPPIFAIPTTAGTGSEVGRSAVVSDDNTKVKKILFSPRLLPTEVFVDPELTLALPPAITASTGMDALTHLLEAFLAVGFHPMADGIALEGIRLVARSLQSCVQWAENSPQDEDAKKEFLQARGLMMNAALMGAVAFQKGLGVTHSCAHALSTVCDTHHGLANGVLLPYTMRFNSLAVPERFIRLAQVIDLTPSTAEEFLQWIIQLRKKINIPHSLKDIGIKKDQLSNLVEVAMQDGCHQSNPCPVTEKDFTQIFQAAFEGKYP